jgi:hypothetical protein
MTDRRILRMIAQFNLTLQDESIESYFQIPYAKFNLRQLTPTTFHFTIQQETIPKLTVDLPSDLRVYIGGFLYENKVAVFELSFPSDYPFKPTKWSVVDQYHTDKCEKVVHYQNHRYDISWSPAITLEKDILNMIDAYFYV